jgi:hypothetical protein
MYAIVARPVHVQKNLASMLGEVDAVIPSPMRKRA